MSWSRNMADIRVENRVLSRRLLDRTRPLLHGFLAYLAKCAATGQPHAVLGYGGTQARDNHSWDLVNAFWHFVQNPRTVQFIISAAAATPIAQCWKPSRFAGG
jgi:hypothetical protein